MTGYETTGAHMRHIIITTLALLSLAACGQVNGEGLGNGSNTITDDMITNNGYKCTQKGVVTDSTGKVYNFTFASESTNGYDDAWYVVSTVQNDRDLDDKGTPVVVSVSLRFAGNTSKFSGTLRQDGFTFGWEVQNQFTWDVAGAEGTLLWPVDGGAPVCVRK